MRERYVLRDGDWVERTTGEPLMRPGSNRPICAPMVMRDTPDYASPIDGRMITSRSHRREDLRRNDCVEVDPPKRPRGFKNKRFAQKRGLQVNEEFR